MDRLCKCLEILLDESKPLEQRLDAIAPKGRPPFIKGLGRAVITPILMCVYPDRYSVYNRISDEGLKQLGRNTIKESDSFSKRYASLNAACQQLSDEIQQPLYLIDSMFSLMVHGVESPLTMLPRADGGKKSGPGSTGDWVVIELKKGHESDRVVGQLLRYMGWILKHKATAGEKVRGIIITGMADDRIKYAVSAIEGIEFFTYNVRFDLVEEKVE
jgi:hypothetical protein